MIKNFLLVMALLSLALAGGCAKGGNGIVPPPVTVTVNTASGISPDAIYPTQTVILTAVTTVPAFAAVTWTLSGPGAITATTPPDAATMTSATATYVAPDTPGAQPIVTATLVSDTSITGPLTLNVVDITTEVTPLTPSVGTGLTQQFTAIALPPYAPQTYTWTCTANGVPCSNFVQDPNVSGLVYYTAQDNCSGSCVQVSAATPLDPTGCSPNPKLCTIGKASLVTSRVTGTYAFRFSGYDSSNHATAAVGTFTASANGTITSGVEDEITSSGPAQHLITGGSYKPTSSDPNNSNNAGTLTLTTGTFPDKFQVVLDSAGDIEMIEADGQGTGSGVAQISPGSGPFNGNQTFAFGFTGVDSTGNRVGYVGLLPMNGSGVISGAQMDANDNGNATNICGAGPCNITNATYTADQNISGLWHMTLTPGSATAMNFDFFIAAQSKTTPLTFYAISTDPIATHPAVSGTMVLQDSSQTYTIAAFNGISISTLTGTGPNGTGANVSLTLGVTDGNGDFSGQFDQNNAGTIVIVPSSLTTPNFAYTYSTSATNGRYIFNMLGNPDSTTVVKPLPFVLYASGANRGFLLDQSSPSVMTGTMNPQGKGSGLFGTTNLPGTYAAATTSSASSTVGPIAANLLLTYQGVGVNNVNGTQYPGAQPVAETYTMTFAGTGTMAPIAPATAPNYAIYVLDTSGCTLKTPICTILDFFMIDEDTTTTTPSVIFAQQ